MKIKWILIVIIAFSILAFPGCISGNNKETPITDTNVYEGTDGLEIEFLTDSPPSEVYEGETFQVATLLKNKGAYPINYGRLVLTYAADDFNVIDSNKQFRLNGKDMYDKTDDQEVLSFYVNASKLMALSRTIQSPILVTACYDYSTKLTADICIDTDPHSTKTIEKPCKSSALSFSGQGSPVTVTKIEQKMMASSDSIRPQFKIFIKNSGKGEVVSRYKLTQVCSGGSIDKDDVNGVVLKDIRFSDFKMDDMECFPKTLKLIAGEDYFICTLKEDKAISNKISTFTTNLYLEFDYGYTLTKSREVTIKKITT